MKPNFISVLLWVTHGGHTSSDLPLNWLMKVSIHDTVSLLFRKDTKTTLLFCFLLSSPVIAIQ